MIEPTRSVYHAKKSDNIEITCQYTGGKPKPLIKWYLNGTRLVNYAIRLYSLKRDPFNVVGSNNKLLMNENMKKTPFSKYLFNHNVLIIRNVSKQDTGVYTCSLSNGYHLEQSLNFTLIVQGKILHFFWALNLEKN